MSVALKEHRIKVLLVDDQAIVAAAVQKMLAPEEDILFRFCQDPAQAMQTATEFEPTVILQDLIMPDIDGLTLVRFFRGHSRLKDVPLIVLSTKEEATTKAEAFARGANDYLVKLPDRIELVARIRYHSTGYINLLQRNEAYAALLASRQALAAELASAAEYVVSLLPASVSDGPARTEWRFFPSAELGGDCLGYHWVDEDHFAVYLLDVCGHGVGTALLSVSAFNALRSQTLPGTDFLSPRQVLTALNDAFPMEKQNNLYFTIWYGVYNCRTRRLRYASGGHPPALLYREGRAPAPLMTNNVFIGGFPGVDYQESFIDDVTPSSRLYVFSDGAYEVDRPTGDMWTLDELTSYLAGRSGAGGREIDELYSFLQEMHGKPILEDDFSMLKVTLM
jgi:sigma-B regulation protein RsbU (phosphoserine phosphatase)